MTGKDLIEWPGQAPEDAPVRHPRLAALVEAARDQATPEVRVRPESVYEGWTQRRAARRRTVAAGLAAAAMLLLAVSTLGPRLWSGGTGPTATEGAETVARSHELPSRAAADDGSPGSGATAGPAATLEPRSPARPEGPTLAASIRVEPLEPTEASPEVLGPRRLRLPEGRWSIDSEAPEPVVVELPDGTVELRGGMVHVEVAGAVARIEVRRARVERFDTEGRRVVEPTEPTEPGPAKATGPSAAELAREAEGYMAAGNRAEAIRTLRRLVTRHGRSAAAQAGLIDLGRLLKASGQLDEARCAYALFLERWPGHALAGDVTRAQRALGQGPACDGLRPRR